MYELQQTVTVNILREVYLFIATGIAGLLDNWPGVRRIYDLLNESVILRLGIESPCAIHYSSYFQCRLSIYENITRATFPQIT